MFSSEKLWGQEHLAETFTSNKMLKFIPPASHYWLLLRRQIYHHVINVLFNEYWNWSLPWRSGWWITDQSSHSSDKNWLGGMMMCIWPSEEHTYNFVAEQKHGLENCLSTPKIKPSHLPFRSSKEERKDDDCNLRNTTNCCSTGWLFTWLVWFCDGQSWWFCFSWWSLTESIHEKKKKNIMATNPQKHIGNQIRFAHREVKQRSKSVRRRLTWDSEPGCFSEAGPGSRWGNPFAPGSPLTSTRGCDRKRLACRWWWTRCTALGPAKWEKHTDSEYVLGIRFNKTQLCYIVAPCWQRITGVYLLTILAVSLVSLLRSAAKTAQAVGCASAFYFPSFTQMFCRTCKSAGGCPRAGVTFPPPWQTNVSHRWTLVQSASSTVWSLVQFAPK